MKVVAWNSSNPRVAKVEDGKVTAISFGEAVITATTSNGLTAECNVLVSKIRLDKTSITLDRRASDTLTAIMLPLDTDDPIIYEPNTTKKKKIRLQIQQIIKLYGNQAIRRLRQSKMAK